METLELHPEIPTSIIGLTLLPVSAEDAPAYYELINANRQHLTQNGDYAELKDATLESTTKMLVDPESRNIQYGIWKDHELVGKVDLTPQAPGHYSLGYWLDEGHTGHGYVGAACSALIDYARVSLGATDIFAGVTKGNHASERVLERLGLKPVDDMGTYTRFHRPLNP